MVTTFTGHSQGWNAVTEDDGSYILDDAWLAVYGANATIIQTIGPFKVSFTPPVAGSAESVTGSGGEIAIVSAHVDVFGDTDVIFFDSGDNVLNLTRIFPGAWSTLFATSGVVNLIDASLSIVGGGVTVNAVSGDDAVSLYQTNGVADTVNGDDVTVALNGAQATIDGSGDAIWFEGGGGSTVTINSAADQSNTTYGAGTINLAGGAVSSIGGGVLVNFLNPGAVARLSYTQGVWDRVQGAAGQTTLYEAQAVIIGGGQRIYFLSAVDNVATLAQTNGDWDAVYGFATTLYVDNAQANIFGSVNELRLLGPQAEVSIYGPSTFVFAYAEAANIVVNQATVEVVGGGNKIFVSPDAGAQITISGTQGAWDVIYANHESVSLAGAEGSIVGGGNAINLSGGSNSVSIYNTGADLDYFANYNGGGAVTLNDAEVANLTNAHIYFGGAANAITQIYAGGDDVFSFTGAFGLDTISGVYYSSFGATDMIELSRSQFADFQAFQNAFTQQGDDAVLTLDANDKAIFKNLSISAVSAAQVTFI